LVRTCLRHSLSILLILLSLPFLAVSFLIASLCAATAAALPRFHWPTQAEVDGRQRAVDQFGFEDAISAYEDLLGGQALKRS